MLLPLTDAISLTLMHSGKFNGLEGSFIGCLIFVIVVPIFAGVCFYTWACGWEKTFSLQHIHYDFIRMPVNLYILESRK